MTHFSTALAGFGLRRLGTLVLLALMTGCLLALSSISFAAPVWTQRTLNGAAGSPPIRSSSAMVYDSARRVSVLFGGFSNTSNLNDTWEWDGTSWTQRTLNGAAGNPPSRSSFAMVYDSARGVTVLFGGANGYMNDTWEWDGTSWTQKTAQGAVGSPPNRYGHTMVYDSARRVTVLFGGGGNSGNLNDTWEWDGTSWTQRTVNGAAGSPPNHNIHAMSYDSARRVTVLFGGVGTGGNLNDTWEWDGTSWTQRTLNGAAGSPPARSGHVMVYDSARRVTVLFGGINPNVSPPLNDTWEWNGTRWTQRTLNGAAGSPPSRSAHAMSYDSARAVIVLFGGASSTNTLNDTWECIQVPPTVSLRGASIAEGNSGTKILNFPLTLSTDSTEDITVTYSTVNGTATAGSDYVGVTDGTATIIAGRTTGSIAITINGDSSFEPDDTFTVALSGATGATLGTPRTATGTITNDDVEAGSLVVTTLIDNSTNTDGLTSLREAINNANANADQSAITFDARVFGSHQIISVGSSLPSIDSDLSIAGPTLAGTGVTIQTATSATVFPVGSGNVTFSNLTVTSPYVGIYVRGGTVLIQNCALVGDTTNLQSNACGVLIQNAGSVATVRNCTVAGLDNVGIRALKSTIVTVENCTISGNYIGIDAGFDATLGGTRPVLNLKNSMVVGNSSGNVFGTISSGSNNITSGSAAQAGLDTVLRDNGGPTQTFALLTGSPAFNAGDPAFDGSGQFDQRGAGFPRVQNGRLDIGAFELKVPIATSGTIINEFRLSGPSGASDEFIELYNQTNQLLDLTGWSVAGGSVTVPIPANKVIPPYGRLLLTGSAYSLKDYGGTNAATSDVPYTGDIPLGSTLMLRNAAGDAVDTVNSASLPAPTSSTSDYSFVRRMDGTGGAPQAGGDFNTVDVASTVGPNNTTGLSSNILRLGSPGPQNLASPIVANQFITFTPATAVPTSVRVGSGNSGTLALRYVVANPAGSGRTITALRFRASALTAGTTVVASDGTNSNGPADVRLISSSALGTILPLTLQSPPAQANGGGLNSSVSLGGLPAGGIAAGTSVTVEFLFNVVQRGQYRFLLNLEPVTTTP